MKDVVLVDVESDTAAVADGERADAGVSSPPDPTSPTGSRTGVAWLRRSRRWWPVVAGLTLVVVASTVVTDRRESARLAALADVPGILAPIDGPVSELWRTDGQPYTSLAEFAGGLLTTDYRPNGRIDVVALDKLTGKVVWRTAARSAGTNPTNAWTDCALPRSPHPGDHATGARVVACVVVDETDTIMDHAIRESTFPTKAHLLLVDATSGAVLSESPTDPSTSVSSLDTDLVISHVGADGRVQVTRTDSRGIADRWTFTSPDPVARDAFGQSRVWVRVAGDLVIINTYDSGDNGNGGSSWVLSGDGDVIRSLTTDAGFNGGIDVLAEGKLLTEPASSAGPMATTIIDVITGRSFTADAVPSGASPDDGSLANLVLMQSPTGDDLIAYDLTSGRPRWTVPAAGGSGTVIIDGRIIRAGAGELTSIEGRTGDTVWVTPLTQTATGTPGYRQGMASLVTDGRLVLLTQSDPAGGFLLAAYGLDDGRKRWTTEIADDLYLTSIDGGLFGWSERGLVALG